MGPWPVRNRHVMQIRTGQGPMLRDNAVLGGGARLRYNEFRLSWPAFRDFAMKACGIFRGPATFLRARAVQCSEMAGN